MELIDISSLNQRYKINRNAVNDRINVLKIKRTKRGKITPEDLVLMDRYHDHICKGGTISNFPLSPEVVVPNKVFDAALDAIVNNESIAAAHYATGALYCLAEAIASIKVEYNPIKNMQLLQEAAEKGYILSTKQIHELCGFKPKNSLVYGKFKIIKTEQKISKSFAWEVVDIQADKALKKL
jgi:hypothetical protein